jgi:isopenicillin-N N-acyltransferase-like protein
MDRRQRGGVIMTWTQALSRREFLRRAAAGAGATCALAGGRGTAAAEQTGAPEFTLTVISGKPRERGRQYGRRFKDAIAAFLDKEIYQAFVKPPAPRDALLRYAGQCAGAVKELSPLLHDELEGMAEGSGLKLEELVLLSLHEELYHKGVLPSVDHCHVAAAGPPVTTGDTYVGQTWDWMASAYGKAQMLLWKRAEGPSLLAYAYPGLWVGAGLNAAGIAHCWTSVFNDKGGSRGPRVGIPSYVLIAHLLYQDSLQAVAREAKRARHAGWFTFVFADGKGNLLNVEGSPTDVAVEPGRGIMVRHQFGSRQMTHTPEGKSPPLLGRSAFLLERLQAGKGKVDRAYVQGVLADDKVGAGALDLMVFDTTRRQAHVSRGPGARAHWQRFTFDDEAAGANDRPGRTP